MFRRNYHSVSIAVRITASLLLYVYITVLMGVIIAVRIYRRMYHTRSTTIAVRITV